MKFIQDLIAILTSLSLVDYILYFSVLMLLILIISFIFILNNDDEIGSEPVKKEELDLNYIVNKIDENPTPLIDMTEYEEEQEQKAIISYDELVNESNKKQLLYEKEQLIDNCIPAKKINLNDFVKEEKQEYNDANVFHYEREEAFLQTLK